MKRTLTEILSILITAVIAALIFNQASGNKIHIFQSYKDVKLIDIEHNVEFVDIEVFRFYLGKDRSIVLDARPRAEYLAGHIPGAGSFSNDEFDTLFREKGHFLKLVDIVIVYCSGSTCEDSSKLANKLLEMGIKNVFVFKGGMEEWIGSGYEITGGHIY